jgi:hypothetical protein
MNSTLQPAQTGMANVDANPYSSRLADAPRKIIGSASGIVHQLLKMLNAGTADVDRWGVVIKGLLGLGLFG